MNRQKSRQHKKKSGYYDRQFEVTARNKEWQARRRKRKAEFWKEFKKLQHPTAKYAQA